MSKQVTRWFGKSNRDTYEVWSKKPAKYSPYLSEFVDASGNATGKDYINSVCHSGVIDIVPNLRAIKVGQVRKVRIIVD